MNMLNKNLNLNELSMGMSSDYLDAIKNAATYVELDLIFLGKEVSLFEFCFFIN